MAITASSSIAPTTTAMTIGAAVQTTATTGTSIPSATATNAAEAATATAQSSPSNDSAVKIGIGVGLAIGILILIVLCVIAFALIRRRRKAVAIAQDDAPSTTSRASSDVKLHEAPVNGAGVYEMGEHNFRELEDSDGSHLMQKFRTESLLRELEGHPTIQEKSELDAKAVPRAELE
jgi:hypothetical protein